MLDGDERTGIQADNCSKDILTLTILVKESDLKAYSMRGCFLCNCLTMELITVPGSHYYFNPKLFEIFIYLLYIYISTLFKGGADNL